ncbi:MAG: hypothetical protein CMJ64_15075 [Planctomycetaceae bacterium]|nr:hypothetical protein [Planctomycetaceae bacterium]
MSFNVSDSAAWLVATTEAMATTRFTSPTLVESSASGDVIRAQLTGGGLPLPVRACDQEKTIVR